MNRSRQGQPKEALLEALLETFTIPEMVRLLNFRMGVDLNAVAGPGPSIDQFFDLIEYLDRRNSLAGFVAHVQASRPQSLELASVARMFLHTPEAVHEGPNPDLERLLRRSAVFHDIDVFLVRLAELGSRICRIEYSMDGGVVFGTGALVAHDRVLTNHHVVAPVLAGTVDPEAVSLRFDFRADAKGMPVSEGASVGLASREWCLAESPPADEDRRAGPAPATPERLDYALLLLSRGIGGRPAGDLPGVGAPDRGWIELPTGEAMSLSGEDVLILHHPHGELLKLTFGRMMDGGAGTVRYRYDANTLGGSSGGLVLDGSLDWIALHHSGHSDPSTLEGYNQGVPIRLIAADLKQKGII